MKLPRTPEVPDERDGHVLFTHPRTWLRDLDPFARATDPLTFTEQKRDQHIWGERLSYVMPASKIDATLASEGLFSDLFLAGGVRVIADADCPPDRAYFITPQQASTIEATLGQLAERVAKIGGKPHTAVMHPMAYQRLVDHVAAVERAKRVGHRASLRSSLWKALGLGEFEMRFPLPKIEMPTFFPGAV